MTLPELIKLICTLEGKKHQASVGDVREILGIIVGIDAALTEATNDYAGPIHLLERMSESLKAAQIKKRRKKK